MIGIYISDPESGVKSIDVAQLRAIREGDQSAAPNVWIDLNEPTVEEEDQILVDLMGFQSAPFN